MPRASLVPLSVRLCGAATIFTVTVSRDQVASAPPAGTSLRDAAQWLLSRE